jgi:hypothetical protein
MSQVTVEAVLTLRMLTPKMPCMIVLCTESAALGSGLPGRAPAVLLTVPVRTWTWMILPTLGTRVNAINLFVRVIVYLLHTLSNPPPASPSATAMVTADLHM